MKTKRSLLLVSAAVCTGWAIEYDPRSTAPAGTALFVDGTRAGDGMPEACGKER